MVWGPISGPYSLGRYLGDLVMEFQGRPKLQVIFTSSFTPIVWGPYVTGIALWCHQINVHKAKPIIDFPLTKGSPKLPPKHSFSSSSCHLNYNFPSKIKKNSSFCGIYLKLSVRRCSRGELSLVHWPSCRPTFLLSRNEDSNPYDTSRPIDSSFCSRCTRGVLSTSLVNSTVQRVLCFLSITSVGFKFKLVLPSHGKHVVPYLFTRSCMVISSLYSCPRGPRTAATHDCLITECMHGSWNRG